MSEPVSQAVHERGFEPPTAGPAIETRGLAKVYHDPRRGRVEALRSLDLTCSWGEVYGLLGPNGAGKTSTLRILGTILAPSAGTARVAGLDVRERPLEVRQRIGYLSATTGLYPRLTGWESLRYFGRLHGMAPDALERRIEELGRAFDLGSFADRRCESMSTGQRQRINISRAVLHEPPVLILDEPTTGLDILATSDMIEFIGSMRAAGTCVLFSTHVLSEAERLCDRIGVIHRGRLLASGTLDELRAVTGMKWLDEIFHELVRRAGEPETSEPVVPGDAPDA